MSLTQDEIISMMKEAGFYFGKDDVFIPEWGLFADLVAAYEREACAKVADRHSTCLNDTPNVIAVAIRSRGDK